MVNKIYLISVVKNELVSVPIAGYSSKTKLYDWLKTKQDIMSVEQMKSYKTFSEKLKTMMNGENYRIALDRIYKIEKLPINPE